MILEFEQQKFGLCQSKQGFDMIWSMNHEEFYDQTLGNTKIENEINHHPSTLRDDECRSFVAFHQPNLG